MLAACAVRECRAHHPAQKLWNHSLPGPGTAGPRVRPYPAFVSLPRPDTAQTHMHTETDTCEHTGTETDTDRKTDTDAQRHAHRHTLRGNISE